MPNQIPREEAASVCGYKRRQRHSGEMGRTAQLSAMLAVVLALPGVDSFLAPAGVAPLRSQTRSALSASRKGLHRVGLRMSSSPTETDPGFDISSVPRIDRGLEGAGALSQVTPWRRENGAPLGQPREREQADGPATEAGTVGGGIEGGSGRAKGPGGWQEMVASVALSVGFLWALTHTVYFLSLFLLGLRSSVNPWSLGVWKKAVLFAKSDLAAGFVGNTLSGLLYQPLIQVTIDVRWVVALVGALPLSRKLQPFASRAVELARPAAARFAEVGIASAKKAEKAGDGLLVAARQRFSSLRARVSMWKIRSKA